MACSGCQKRREAIQSALKTTVDIARRVILSTPTLPPGQRTITGVVKHSVKRDNRQ